MKFAMLEIGKIILSSYSSKTGTGSVSNLSTTSHWEILKLFMYLLGPSFLPRTKDHPILFILHKH